MDFAALSAPQAIQGDLVYFSPRRRQMLYVNPSYERVLGNRMATMHDELPGWWDALHPDDRLAHAATGQLIENVELRLTRPDSSPR